MAVDTSIIGRLQQSQIPQENPLDAASKAMMLQHLMLQNTVGRKALEDEDAVSSAYKKSGGDPTVLRSLLFGAGQHKAVDTLDKNLLEKQVKTATLAHTTAQTGDLMAGHMAGGLAALAKGGGSDEAVAQTEKIMAPLVGPDQARATTAALMAMPAEQRVQYAMQQASSHKTGQEALKILFPAAHEQNFGGTSAPISLSTLPGSTPGAIIPGGIVTPNTQTPDSVATNATSRANNASTNARIASEGALGRAQADEHWQNAPHYVLGADAEGNQTVHTLDKDGNVVNSSKTGSLVPSWQNNANIRERQLAGSMDKVIKPHLEVLDAAQKFEAIKASGDNSQANQFLAQQLGQMSKSGTRASLPKAQLEQILGTTFEGGDWVQRASNYVSQIASGTRTPELDAKLTNLADAMSLAAAQRIGQEIQNTRARTPSGVNPDRVVGDQPRIYGRFIITPTGTVFAGKNSADAQAKLAAMQKAAAGQ